MDSLASWLAETIQAGSFPSLRFDEFIDLHAARVYSLHLCGILSSTPSVFSFIMHHHDVQSSARLSHFDHPLVYFARNHSFASKWIPRLHRSNLNHESVFPFAYLMFLFPQRILVHAKEYSPQILRFLRVFSIISGHDLWLSVYGSSICLARNTSCSFYTPTRFFSYEWRRTTIFAQNRINGNPSNGC